MWTFVSLAVSLVLAVTVVLADPQVRPRVSCTQDHDCDHVPESECSNGACTCTGELHYFTMEPIGCYPRDSRAEAIRQFKQVRIQDMLACEVTEDCLHTPETTCSENGECLCPVGTIFFLRPEPGCYSKQQRGELLKQRSDRAQARNQRLGLRGEDENREDGVTIGGQPPEHSCASDGECETYEHAVCRKGACVCDQGDSFFDNGKFVGCFGKHLPTEKDDGSHKKRSVDPTPLVQVGGACSDDSACSLENSGCHPVRRVCACYNGYYKCPEEGTCKEIQLGTSCRTDGSDVNFCRRAIARAYCLDGQCACPDHYPTLGVNWAGVPACVNDALAKSVSELGRADPRNGRTGRRGGRGGRRHGDEGGDSSVDGDGGRGDVDGDGDGERGDGGRGAGRAGRSGVRDDAPSGRSGSPRSGRGSAANFGRGINNTKN